ncbi:unnamed protein product [Parnassius apollo]|uniref:(apollo) hypothetical protein n=1 Tax=Parnassius apollo TaxID=110799 RepID=A0A8S3X879_PARAO|nr:unnamed protein product [Parnassius apollo]
MDIFEVIGILEALKEDKRKHWVHPLYKKRLSIGQFHTLYPELRKHPEKFYDYFNMTSHTFDELLKSITQYIAKNNITRDTLCPEERLTITLRNKYGNIKLVTSHSSSSMWFESPCNIAFMSSTSAEEPVELCEGLFRG